VRGLVHTRNVHISVETLVSPVINLAIGSACITSVQENAMKGVIDRDVMNPVHV